MYLCQGPGRVENLFLGVTSKIRRIYDKSQEVLKGPSSPSHSSHDMKPTLCHSVKLGCITNLPLRFTGDSRTSSRTD